MGWRWLLILFGIFILGICIWLCKTVEPFQSQANSYIFEDVSGSAIAIDISTFRQRIDFIFNTQLGQMEQRVEGVKRSVQGYQSELDGWRRTACLGDACTDRCVVARTTRDGPLSSKTDDCDRYQYTIIPNGNKLMGLMMNTIDIVKDAKQNWLDMIDAGKLNFMNDYADTSGSVPSIPINTTYENASSTFDITQFSGAIENNKFINDSLLEVRNALPGLAESVYDGAKKYYPRYESMLTGEVNIIRDLIRGIPTSGLNFTSSPLLNNAFETIKRMARERLPSAPAEISRIQNIVNKANDVATFLTKPTRGNYSRQMQVIGSLTQKNIEEITTSAQLVRRIWLAIPQNLESYIYVDPDTMKAYVRPPPSASYASDIKCMRTYKLSDDRSKYVIDTYANNFNKRFCTTEITPDLLALLPVTARAFVKSYVQDRRRRISEIAVQSDVEYQEAVKAYYKYEDDLSGLSLKVLASTIDEKINGSSSISGYAKDGAVKTKVYLTRMILEGTTLIQNSATADYNAANTAYSAYKRDLAKDSNLSTTAKEGLVSIYLSTGSEKAKSLFSAMMIGSTEAVGDVNDSDSEYTTAQTAYAKYLKDLRGNVVLAAESPESKVTKYVGGQGENVKGYFVIMLYLKGTDMSLIDTTLPDYIVAKSYAERYRASNDTVKGKAALDKYYPEPGYLFSRSFFIVLIESTSTERASYNMPPAIEPTLYFTNKNKIIYDQLAQAFYDLNDGTKSMTYIYDIYPVGSSIIDVRFDLTTNVPTGGAVAQMQALTAAYKEQLVQNLSVNQRATLISNFQKEYGKIRDTIAEAVTNLKAGATRRFFYSLTGDVLTINGMAADDIAAGSFSTEYNCGLDTPTDDSPGRVNYMPLIKYNKNTSDIFDCTNKATLIQIGIDYVDALSADMADVLATVTRPWDQQSNLYVTKILGVQQLTPLSANIHWEETSFDYMTNEPSAPVVRYVQVAYVRNTSDWFSTEILFDISGFKYLNSAPTGMTRLATPIVLPPPYIDHATLDSGGVCPKVNCSDPATLYKMVDDYNTTEDNPGVILSVIKAVTMNSGQCDLLVDIDYNKNRPDPDDSRRRGTFREQISLSLGLDMTTCKYDLFDYDRGYGIQDQTPLITDPLGNVKPFSYIFDFGVNIFTEVSKAANAVKDQIASVYDVAKTTLTTYRESTFANLGNVEHFEGCPKVQCNSLDIMSTIFQKYDRENKLKNRMRKIIQVGSSGSNKCDVLFENEPILGWNDASGIPIYGNIQTTAARFSFGGDTGSAYDEIFDQQIADLTASGGTAEQIQGIKDQKAAVNAEVNCSFVASSYVTILPSQPTPWAKVQDLNTALPVINPSKNDPKAYPDMFPFPNPFPPMTVNCTDYKVLNAIRKESIQQKTVTVGTWDDRFPSNVIGYTIDSSVPGTLTVTDVRAERGVLSIIPKTLIYSKNYDTDTCAVEMLMEGDYKVHRHFKFTIGDDLQYRMINDAIDGTMPKGQGNPYTEFRDISISNIYNRASSVTPFSESDSVHRYTYTTKPTELNLSIVQPLPLVINPACNLDMKDLVTITAALGYNGYPKPYEVATFPPAFKDLSNSYEIRITENEYLPFGATFKIVSFYTSNCNPIINKFTNSTPIVSQLAKKVGNFNDPVNLAAIRTYIREQFSTYVSDSRPRRRLGQLWEGGFDPKSNLYMYSVTMAEYDADNNVLNFYGYPQNASEPNILPRIYLACEFRRRFKTPSEIYMANMYIMKSSPVPMTIIADTAPTRLDDPFRYMTSYKYLEFIPLAVRATVRPNQKVQLTRLEFYSGNAIQTVTGSLNGEILSPGATSLKSITGFADIFKTDGQSVDLATQSSFVSGVSRTIAAYSEKAIKVDGLSFMTGKDPAFDIVQWKLRGSMNGRFWKDIYTSPQLTYPPYGYWRVPMMSFQNMSTALPQNQTRPKGFIECGATINTVDIVERISRFTYTTYSQSYFTTYSESQKNTSRVYLNDLSDMLVDDFNDTVYVRAKIESLDSTYKLTLNSITFALSFERTKTCVQNYSITTIANLRILKEKYNAKSYMQQTSITDIPAFTPIVLNRKLTDVLPFAYGGYPSALTKYTRSSISLEPVPPYTVTTFLSNGPDRPATVTLPQALTSYTNMAPEGAAQMCQDNLACLGFSVNTDGMSGSFVSTPTSSTTIVDSAGVGGSGFFVKAGFNLVAYVRFRSMKSGSPLSISKVAFYKGSTLAPFTLNAGNSYAINAEGGQTGSVLLGWELANLVNYTTTSGWKAEGVDGFMLRFQTPLLFDGYTFVTTSLPTSSDPTAWIVETSMNGRDWTLFDRRTGVVPPAPRFTVYPVFRQPTSTGASNDGATTDFSAKTVESCRITCQSLIPNMVSLYLQQTTTAANNFFVNSVGSDPNNNMCLLGWEDAMRNPRVTGFVFNPVFGECSNISVQSNITIRNGLSATGLTRITDTGQFRYLRFKPTALNGGTGTSLSFIGFLYRNVLLQPDRVENIMGQDDTAISNVIDTTLSNVWTCNAMGHLIFTFSSLASADSFTMITGRDAARAPVSWILESSPDRIVWSLLHEQTSPVVAPAATKQYQMYFFNGPPQTPIKGVLDRTIQDAGYTCASDKIINGDNLTVPKGVNDEAFDRSIFFNPVSYTYDNLRNQCNYLQGSDGTTLTVTFLTTKSRSTSTATSGFVTTIANMVTTSTPLINPTPFTSGLQGISDCSPASSRYACDISELLVRFDTAFKNDPINPNKGPLSASKTAYDPSRNECIFELEDMYAPLNRNGAPAIPSKQVGFQIKKNTGCTVPGAQALIINKNITTDKSLTAPTASGPYRFIRFKVIEGGLNIGAFEFFKRGVVQPYSATVSNPLGSYRATDVATGLQSFVDSLVKPIQFNFKRPLDFDGYSWTTGPIASADTIAWVLQASTNGYIWTDLDTRKDASIKPRGFKMPIYGLDKSTTTRGEAEAQTYGLKTCEGQNPIAEILASAASRKIIEDNGFSQNITVVSRQDLDANNTCKFGIQYDDDPTNTVYTVSVKYKRTTKETDVIIDSITRE